MKTTVYLATISICFLYSADTFGGKQIYWTGGYDLSPIQRANPDGSNIETIINGLNTPTDISLDMSAGKMYWGMWVDGLILRSNLDGSEQETIIHTGQRNVWGVAVDSIGGKVYWTDPYEKAIRRSNLNGSGIEDLIKTVEQPVGIALDNKHNKLYWTDEGTGKIQRSNFDGSGIEDVLQIESLMCLADIELDLSNDAIYWVESDYSKRIGRVKMDGTGMEYVIPSLDSEPYAMALDCDSSLIYWTTYNGEIMRADFDGSNMNTILSLGERNAWGIAITPEPCTLLLLAMGGLVIHHKRH